MKFCLDLLLNTHGSLFFQHGFVLTHGMLIALFLDMLLMSFGWGFDLERLNIQ